MAGIRNKIPINLHVNEIFFSFSFRFETKKKLFEEGWSHSLEFILVFFLISLYCLVEENFPRKMQLFGLINQSYNFTMQGI